MNNIENVHLDAQSEREIMNDTTISVGDTQRRLGKSRPTLTKLASAGMLHREVGGYRRADVERLELQRLQPFVPWNEGDELYFAVPTTQVGGWNSDLWLSEENDRATAETGLGGVPEGFDITGWWPARNDMFARLQSEHVTVLGIVGGYVHQAGHIRKGFRRLSDRRCAYLIEPIHGEEFANLAGFVEGSIGHTGMYVTKAFR